MENIENQIIKIIAKELDLPSGSIKKDTLIMDDLGADSLDVINIAMAIEDSFKVEIDDNLLSEFNTIESIVNALTMTEQPETKESF
jgi:acyl carrier protein